MKCDIMLAKFGGDLMRDVGGLSPADRFDLEDVDKRLKRIENWYGMWASFALITVGVFFLIGGLTAADLDSSWSRSLSFAGFGCLPAGLTAWLVAHISRQKTLNDLEVIETMLRVKHDRACTALIRERVFRSPLLARTLASAFNRANVSLPIAP